MNEVELKILEVDVDKITQKLLELGAEKVFEGEIDAVFFDTEDDLIRHSNQLLRVRKKGDKVELCFKKGNDKTCIRSAEEIEVNVNNFENTLKILEGLGYIIKGRQPKKRVSYRIGNVLFEFDTMPGIPTFLEIESTSEEAIKEWVEKLGFTMNDTTNMHCGQVSRYYKNKSDNIL